MTPRGDAVELGHRTGDVRSISKLRVYLKLVFGRGSRPARSEEHRDRSGIHSDVRVPRAVEQIGKHLQ